jgi:hypothetical protein
VRELRCFDTGFQRVALKNKTKEKKMSNEAVKLTEKAGTSISKEKLLEAIRKSPNKHFTLSQALNSKLATVVVDLQ